LRRDILSAYAASIARVVSWVIVSALVYRRNADDFAMLALVRGTMGILNYCSLGVLPAMIQALALVPPRNVTSTRRLPGVSPLAVQVLPADAETGSAATLLPYATTKTTRQRLRRPWLDLQTQRIYATGLVIAGYGAVIAALITIGIAADAGRVFRVPAGMFSYESLSLLILCIGLGTALRWFSDPAAALLQTRNRIAIDNLLLVLCEIVWVVTLVLFLVRGSFPAKISGDALRPVAVSFVIASGFLCAARVALSYFSVGAFGWAGFDWRICKTLCAMGGLITLAQLADYLYAPTDYILINRLLTPADLAAYAPALQMDAGLMILVTGLAAVLLPKAAVAQAGGERERVRRYYVVGTLVSAVLLAGASALAWFLAPAILRLWLGRDMPETRAILPLVFAHTTLGGSAAVGRSILLAMGRTRPFTVSVLLAGITNVVASYVFVRYLHLGLRGIVLGTIVAVVARCGIWMPWYILRELRSSRRPRSGDGARLRSPA
jgi:O-antigen/teichoic acid export membrane protein